MALSPWSSPTAAAISAAEELEFFRRRRDGHSKEFSPRKISLGGQEGPHAVGLACADPVDRRRHPWLTPLADGHPPRRIYDAEVAVIRPEAVPISTGLCAILAAPVPLVFPSFVTKVSYRSVKVSAEDKKVAKRDEKVAKRDEKVAKRSKKKASLDCIIPDDKLEIPPKLKEGRLKKMTNSIPKRKTKTGQRERRARSAERAAALFGEETSDIYIL